jgi:hypothetical protein
LTRDVSRSPATARAAIWQPSWRFLEGKGRVPESGASSFFIPYQCRFRERLVRTVR